MDSFQKFDILLTVAKKLNLTGYDYEQLVHDVNNLRGKEWLPEIEKLGSPDLLRKFKMVLKEADEL